MKLLRLVHLLCHLYDVWIFLEFKCDDTLFAYPIELGLWKNAQI